MKINVSKFLLIIGVSLFSYAALAQEDQADKEMPKSSPTHVVGFTFHKLAGSKPDLNKWTDVYLHNKFNNYGQEGRKEKVRQTKARFVNMFNNFSEDDYKEIIVVLPAKMEVVPFENRYLVNVDVGAALDFIIKETPEFLINLVIPDLEEKFKPIISKKDYDGIKKLSGLTFETPQFVNIVLKLKPKSVDARAPVIIDGKEYWLMLMEFETYEVWHGLGYKLYWKYISEEEKKKKLEDLRSLYKTTEEEKQIEEF